MRKILSYILTPVYLFIFAFLLLFFHPIQVICYNLFGYKAQKKSVDVLNFFLLYSLIILGCRISFRGIQKIPKGHPLIIISNHQGSLDVPPIVWGFRKFYPKFVSKIELAKNLPSISYNLKIGNSALIDRKNRAQALEEIQKLGEHIEKNNYSAVIFPEGTRSKTGKVKRFSVGGISTLLNTAPSAIIIPFVINGSSKLEPKKLFPLRFGTKLTYTALDPIYPKEMKPEEAAKTAEMVIKKHLNQYK